ncbi:MAG: glycosyltransferase family 2 protein [Candidatus Aenigmatarchaeota archaeon]
MPAYNEGNNIGESVSLAISDLKGAKIIVVDDGSEDNTAKIAKMAGAIVLRHGTNKGKGEALNTGFSFVKQMKDAKYVVLLDADMQYRPKDAENVLLPLIKNEADFVMGSREWSAVPFRHRLGNLVWRLTFNLLFGTKLKDTNCGLVAMNRNALEAIGRVQGGYIIDNYMLIKCIRSGLIISNAPVTVYYKYLSKVPRGVRMVIGIWLFIVKEGLKYRLGR